MVKRIQSQAKKDFQESITSNLERMDVELKDLKDQILPFKGIVNNPYEVRHRVRYFRQSINKLTMYISYIEGFNEIKLREE